MKTIQNIQLVAQIADLEKIGVEIEFTPENEDVSPSDNIDDQETINYIIDQYNNGNEAAWFCAKIEVRYKGVEGTDYLGCCSYKSFKQFQSDGSGYYVDMINQCINQINSDIESRNEQIKEAWDIRRAKNLVKPYGYDVFQAVFPKLRKSA